MKMLTASFIVQCPCRTQLGGTVHLHQPQTGYATLNTTCTALRLQRGRSRLLFQRLAASTSSSSDVSSSQGLHADTANDASRGTNMLCCTLYQHMSDIGILVYTHHLSLRNYQTVSASTTIAGTRHAEQSTGAV